MITLLVAMIGTILGGVSIALFTVGIVIAVDMITDDPYSVLNWVFGLVVVCLSTLYIPLGIICFVYAAGGTI